MRNWIKEVLAAPSLSDEKEKVHLTYTLKIIIYVILAAVISHGVIFLIISAEIYSRILLFFDLPAAIFFTGVLLVLRTGRVRMASLMATSGMWLMFTIAISLVGGVRAPMFVGGYLIAIFMAGILLGLRISMYFTIVCILSTLGLGLAGQMGWLPPPESRFSYMAIVFVESLAMVGTFTLVQAIHYSLYRSVIEVDVETAKREKTESIMAKNERRFTALMENNQDMVALVDATGRLQYVSPSVGRIMGYPTDSILNQAAFDYMHPDDISRVQSVFARLILAPKSSQRAEFRMRHHNGNWRWVDCIASNLLLDPDIHGIIIDYRDITDHKREEEQREHDAIHDSLTGLCNRILFLDRLENMIRRNSRSEENAFAVILLDVDHFKNINDSLGHSAGDDLLNAIARRLETCVRASDTVARLGGDEFGILLDQADGYIAAEVIASRVEKELMKEPIPIAGRELIISASIGIALADAKYERADEYLRDAEIAMYHAKSLGRAQHIFFEDRLREGVLERVGLEAELRRAMEKNEFVVYYQPVFSLQHGGLVGYEALVRWQHPSRGLLLPGEFISVAEDSGLIVDLDRWVMGEACRQMRDWQLRYPDAPPLIINVNLSRRQLIKADLIDTVQQILAETGLDPGLLRPEITENLIMENIDYATNTLRLLDTMGVRAEIDDFGSGYSSLAVLTTLPVRTLKIDRSFVNAMGEGGDRYEVIRTIVALGHSLSMEIIAEGIENQSQLKQLRELGCEYGQGFLFSRGLDSDGAEALIANGVRIPAD